MNASTLSIAIAAARGTLRVEQKTGRMGPYVAISDNSGIITVALSLREAASELEAAGVRVQSEA